MSHSELKRRFTLQFEEKKLKELQKVKSETTGLKNSAKFKKSNSKVTFNMKDFVNKNYNSLIEEYRSVFTDSAHKEQLTGPN